MARNYGHKASARRSSAGPNQLLVLVFAFLCGYLTAIIFDIDKLTQWLNKQVLAEHKPQAPKPAAKVAQTLPKPKFEFYTLLANEKVPSQANAASKSAPTKSTEVAVNTAPTAPTNNIVVSSTQAAAVRVVEARPVAIAKVTTKGSFSLQVASFKTRKDAEHTKGLLTLKGYDVRVIAVSQPQGTWFRVVVGPFANKVLAQEAQTSIAKTERLHGMITSTS